MTTTTTIPAAPPFLVAENGAEALEGLNQDPYLGYESLQDAADDCKATSQAEALARILARENIFISGPPGAGKSSIIRPALSLIQSEAPHVKVALTAFTNEAAIGIGGQTLHSWISSARYLRPQRGETLVDVLVIDEVSMVPAWLLDELDKVLKRGHRTKEPFGGIQIIMLGDFAQLPPVPDEDKDSRFAIFANSWKNANIRLCYMDKMHRAADETLRRILVNISNGRVTDEDYEELEKRSTAKLGSSNGAKNISTRLFATNRKIDEFNAKELAKIPKPSKVYQSSVNKLRIDRSLEVDEKKGEKAVTDFLKLNGSVELKVGALVVATATVVRGSIVNGTLARILSMDEEGVVVWTNRGDKERIPYLLHEVKIQGSRERPSMRDPKKMIKAQEQVVYAQITRLPLRLAYAISIHKSQGKTFDALEIDLASTFMPNLGYVAISRVRSLDTLLINGLNQKALKMTDASLKITSHVKKSALKNRRAMLDDPDLYDGALQDGFARMMFRPEPDGQDLFEVGQKQNSFPPF